MTFDRPEYVQGKPVSEVAQAIYEAAPYRRILWGVVDGTPKITGREALPWEEAGSAQETCYASASAALKVLIRHGWITDLGLRAIHLEEAKNGETGNLTEGQETA